MREDDSHAVQVSASQRTPPDPNGTEPARFWGASSDGSVAYFTTCQKLTDDSTAVSTASATCESSSQGQDLYRFDTDSGQLTEPHRRRQRRR